MQSRHSRRTVLPGRRRARLLLAAVAVIAATGAGTSFVKSAREAHGRRVHDAIRWCTVNLTTVGTALEHYRSEHEGAWPRSVDDLVPDYLRQTGDCAREEAGGRQCQYTPPAESAPDTAVVIRCTRTPGVVVVLRKDSEVVVEGPDSW
jgi:hypothetical protein